jgi:hypothetical protein
MTALSSMKNKKKEKEKNKSFHLSEVELNKLIEEEPEITVKGYLSFIKEINDIQNSNDGRNQTID